MQPFLTSESIRWWRQKFIFPTFFSPEAYHTHFPVPARDLGFRIEGEPSGGPSKPNSNDDSIHSLSGTGRFWTVRDSWIGTIANLY